MADIGLIILHRENKQGRRVTLSARKIPGKIVGRMFQPVSIS